MGDRSLTGVLFPSTLIGSLPPKRRQTNWENGLFWGKALARVGMGYSFSRTEKEGKGMAGAGRGWFFLSIRQPHAHGVVTGDKKVENRSWSSSFRGPLWIHASKSLEDLECQSWKSWRLDYPSLPADASTLGFGAIIGMVDMVDCLDEEEALERYPDQEDFIGGPWCFLFENPRRLKKPIPWVGNRGFQPISLAPQPEWFV